MQRIDTIQQELFSVMLWSIWKRRNNQVWDIATETNQMVCDRARILLTSWKHAQQARNLTNIVQSDPSPMVWMKVKHKK
ncbi:cytochrome P450, partial [Trifolium medium]|nr:cytochrome P450 [Trifolium medium]